VTKVPHFFGFHGSFSAFSPDVQRVIAHDLEPACRRRRRTLDLSLRRSGVLLLFCLHLHTKSIWNW